MMVNGVMSYRDVEEDQEPGYCSDHERRADMQNVVSEASCN